MDCLFVQLGRVAHHHCTVRTTSRRAALGGTGRRKQRPPPPPREHREPFLYHGQLEDVVLDHALDEPMPAGHVDEPEVSRHISVSAAAWHQVHDSVILFSSPEHAFPEICV